MEGSGGTVGSMMIVSERPDGTIVRGQITPEGPTITVITPVGV